MPRFLLVVAALLVSLPVAQSACAQDLMPPHVAKQLGLTQAWMRPINAPFGSQSIADLKLHVHQSDPHEYIEIVQVTDPEKPADKSTEESDAAAASPQQDPPKVFGRINTRRVGKATPEAGRVEAQRLADNEIRRLKRRGINAKAVTRNVPRVNLYSIASNGMLESRDAETGEIDWTVRIGNRNLPFFSIGADDERLSIINGSNLIVVDVNTGEELSAIRMRGTPLYGAINAGEFALIPMIASSLEGYRLSDPKRDPFLRHTSGSALAMPTKAPDSTRVAWGTDSGYVFVAESSGEPSVLFRLDTDGIVSGRIAAAPGNRFFFGSENGQVYGIRAETRNGEVLWSQPFGEPFYGEPAVVGNQILISTTYGNLVSFSADTGMPNWEQPVPNIAKLIASFDDRLYVTTLSGALGVIDVKSGERVGIFNQVRPGRLLINKQSNRLYLVSDRGEVQCLRPEGAELPTLNVAPDIQPKQPEDEAPKDSDTDSSLDAGDDAPIGADDDPFGGGGDDDPFGGDDPFGDPSASDGDDPFGE